MKNRILFAIIDNQVRYLKDSEMDHREWLTSIGYPMDNFEEMIRGFIMEHKIVFYKGSQFRSDEEVRKAAIQYGPRIRFDLNDSTLEVCCGILVNGVYGDKWEPILRLSEEDLKKGITTTNKEEVVARPSVSPEDVGKVVEFKNDYQDDKFMTRAALVSMVVLVLTILINLYLFQSGKLHSSFIDYLLVIGQVSLLGLSIFHYFKKSEDGKNYAIGASIFLFLNFQILTIILGLLYLLFNIDENYYLKIVNLIKKKKSS